MLQHPNAVREPATSSYINDIEKYTIRLNVEYGTGSDISFYDFFLEYRHPNEVVVATIAAVAVDTDDDALLTHTHTD